MVSQIPKIGVECNRYRFFLCLLNCYYFEWGKIRQVVKMELTNEEYAMLESWSKRQLVEVHRALRV